MHSAHPRRRSGVVALVTCSLLALGFQAGSALGTDHPAASAAPLSAPGDRVIVLGPSMRVRTVVDRFLSPAASEIPVQAALARQGTGPEPPPSTGGSGISGGATTTTSTGTTTTGTTTTVTTTGATTTTGTTGTTGTTTTTKTTGTTTTKTTPTKTTTTGTTTTGTTTTKTKTKTPPAPTVVSALARLAQRGLITSDVRRQYLGQWNGALADEKKLSGTRQDELTAVTETLHQIAADGEMTVSRLPALFMTLQANVQWWTEGPLLSTDQRVQFSGSQIVWEYYPGEGIQLQPLATFGEANGMYTAGPADYPAMESLLAQMLPLAVAQDRGFTWEYYFPFDGGEPPWTSAMTDGTALEAFARAYLATKNNTYLVDGAEILPVLRDLSPKGLSIRTALGRRFLQYSFTPGTDIINAFLQTLVGLFYFSHISGNQLSLTLFDQGNAEAESELPSFNTGAWSLYQPGTEDDLSYHELVTGFLQQLCTLTAAPVYCQTATAFQADLTTPPVLTQKTVSGPSKKAFALSFTLSKVSKVGLAIIGQSQSDQGQTVFQTSAQFPHGTDAITVRALPAGSYALHMSATDLAGNFSRITGTLKVGR